MTLCRKNCTGLASIFNSTLEDNPRSYTIISAYIAMLLLFAFSIMNLVNYFHLINFLCG